MSDLPCRYNIFPYQITEWILCQWLGPIKYWIYCPFEISHVLWTILSPACLRVIIITSSLIILWNILACHSHLLNNIWDPSRTTFGAIRMVCKAKDCRRSCSRAEIFAWRMQGWLYCSPWHEAEQYSCHSWFWTTGMLPLTTFNSFELQNWKYTFIPFAFHFCISIDSLHD